MREKSKELCGLWDSGYNRYGEIINLEVTIDRALETYMKKDYSKEWINQRLQAIQVPKELTDTWNEHGIEEGREYAFDKCNFKSLLRNCSQDNIRISKTKLKR